MRGRLPSNPSFRGKSNGMFAQRLEIGGGVSNSLTTVAKDCLILEIMEQELKKEKDENGKTWYLDEQSGRYFSYRIRKLTPRECFRLMGVRDKDIDTIQAAGISNSQQYKMAGNSIVVDQLVHLFMQMFSPNRKVGKPMPRQLSLFE